MPFVPAHRRRRDPWARAQLAPRIPPPAPRSAPAARQNGGVVEEWRRDAACAQPGVDPEWWSHHNPRLRAQASIVCGRCPVRVECLDWAVDHPDLCNETVYAEFWWVKISDTSPQPHLIQQRGKFDIYQIRAVQQAVLAGQTSLAGVTQLIGTPVPTVRRWIDVIQRVRPEPEAS